MRTICKANAFIVENHFKLSSPPHLVPMHELYVIITHTNMEWMPKTLVEHPIQCMQHLFQLKEKMTLVVTILYAFNV